jgi:hypothetical protein
MVLSYLSRERNKTTKTKDDKIYATLANDWDLDAAFMNSSEPYLYIVVESNKSDSENGFDDDWDVIATVDLPKSCNVINVDNRSFIATWSNHAADKAVNAFQKIFHGLTRLNSSNMGVEHPIYENFNEIKWKQPLTESEFRNFLDSDGRIVQLNELRQRVFEGGVEPQLRKAVWRYLLNIYPHDIAGKQRFDYLKELSNEYYK